MTDTGNEQLKYSVLAVVSVSSFVTPFMGSSVNVALPSIENEFQMDAVALAWIQTAYLLATVVFLVPFGKIADIYGRRKTYISGMVIFTAACALAAGAPGPVTLILARVLQGFGSALLFVTGMAILTSVFPPAERGKAIGISVACVYIGLSAGPFLGGVLTQYLTWRGVFGATVPLGLIATYLAVFRLKGEWADAAGEKLDILGSVLYGVAITLVIYGLTILPDRNGAWMIATGLLLFIGFVWHQFRTEMPVFPVTMFQGNRVFAFSSLAALIHYSGTFAVSFILSLYLQYIKGFDPRTAGLILVAQPVMMALFSPHAGRLSDRLEPQKVASAGMAISAAGLGAFAFLGRDTHTAVILGVLMLLGFGFAVFSSPNMNAIMGSVERRHYGLASATVSGMRLLGQMFSMGVATLVFSIFMGRVQITPDVFPEFLMGARTAFTVFCVLTVLGIFASLARGKLHESTD